MNKCKIIKRKGMRKLLIKGMKGQQLSEWETNAINTEEVVGLLQVDACKKGFVYNLEFDITGYITFKEFLQMPLTKETFARILDNILENLKSVEEKHFNQQLILYDMDKIYINPSTQRIFFAYVPLQPFDNDGSLQEMLLDIIQYSAFDETEENDYVSEYITILNRGINFSVFDLEEYVRGLIKSINGEDEDDMIECPKCHTLVSSNSVFCKCGFKLHGFTGSTGGAGSQVYDMFQNYKENRNVCNVTDPAKDDNNQRKSDEKKDIVVENDVAATAAKNEDPSDITKKKKKPTTVLSLYDEQEPTQAYLIRESNDEKVVIGKASFRMGRESGDYIVSNRYVSDPHVDIITRNNHFYVVDLGSTNKTYMDGVVIPPQQETEIFDGCRLRLANENFQFFIE